MNRIHRYLQARIVSSILGLGILAGCAIGPEYEPPAPPAAPQWYAALPHEGRTVDLLNWWQQFNDPVLLKLIEAAQTGSPSLALAAGRIQEARAGLALARASDLPVVAGEAAAIRSGAGGSASVATQTSRSVGLDASWEIDLFGAVRRQKQAAQAREEASVRQWHEARVSLAAEVAGTYADYRACQRLAQARQSQAQSFRETARLSAIAAEAGFAAPADAALAKASAAGASANEIAQKAQCDLTVKALVSLTGLPEPQLRTELTSGPAQLPSPAEFAVESVPAQLISQRPDLAAAERALAAASAEIGQAQANRYPRLSLLGSIGRVSVDKNGATATSTPWSFGPSLLVALFDPGQGLAAVDAAKARYQQALANYELAVRSAVQEVEQSLVRLDSAARQTADASVSLEGYRAYLTATEANWRAGGESLLNLENARRSAIAAELALIGLQHERVAGWIALYKALGGGWHAAASPSNGETQ